MGKKQVPGSMVKPVNVTTDVGVVVARGEGLGAVRRPAHAELVHEVADLWFHTLVLMAHKNLSAEDILNELSRREGTSGIEEKESRPRK